jgi:Asp-tRNA(Asn)/Glu-tRNA(Gln) amidotransferase C subunit
VGLQSTDHFRGCHVSGLDVALGEERYGAPLKDLSSKDLTSVPIPTHPRIPQLNGVFIMVAMALFRFRNFEPWSISFTLEADPRMLLPRPLGSHLCLAKRPAQPARFQARPFTSCIPTKPTWSTKSLVDVPTPNSITPSELRHLLRLSALPLPDSPEMEERLVCSLQRQVRFVQRIQARDTTGVRPLIALRDETDAAVSEATVKYDDLAEDLDAEVRAGFFKRPRRIRARPVDTKGAEDWDCLSMASEKAGSYFVVRSKQESELGTHP